MKGSAQPIAAVVGIVVAHIALSGGDRFYLVPTYEIGLMRQVDRMPAIYGLSGYEVGCELLAAEMRRAERTRLARCEAVPAWRHWWNAFRHRLQS